MNFEEKNAQKVYFLIVPSMGETKELVILALVSDLARKKKLAQFQIQVKIVGHFDNLNLENLVTEKKEIQLETKRALSTPSAGIPQEEVAFAH